MSVGEHQLYEYWSYMNRNANNNLFHYGRCFEELHLPVNQTVAVVTTRNLPFAAHVK